MLPVVYHPGYVAPLPDTHRFPMAKFRLLCERLLRDRITAPERVFTPELPRQSWLERVHERAYIDAYSQGTLAAKAQRRIGLPWSPALAYRTRIAVGGTILTTQLALKYGIACNTAGGTHHAFPSYGSGFCIFNDLAIAARFLLDARLVGRVLIVDLDVHQGDGTAFIFRDDPAVFTFSMHCADNFPSRKQNSDLDIALPQGLDDDGYLQILARTLPELLERADPDIVLFDAGADVHAGDRLGKLALSDRGLYRRDRLVMSTCIAGGYPVAGVIGGGYASDLNALVERHSQLHRSALDVSRQYRL